MQNLTAHYNILYNAKELVNDSERNIQLAYSDDYDRLISVYKEPNESLSQSEFKKLDDAILKANTIANEKSLSKYVDDAYFLIGQANHLKSNFYNAVEFFDYVYRNYPKENSIRQAALAWKARSLIASDRLEEAETTLDTALLNIATEKKSVADIYATRAQLYIYAREDEQAISLLEKALKTVKDKQKKVRWTYLIAQLQEITHKPQDAFINYTKVVKSNAPFDMAFNANLSRINLKNKLYGDSTERVKEIMALLKDDKNRELIDQIYFQIANTYLDAGNIEKAIENYKLALSKSTKNVTQKGLTYLKLAEIYFAQTDFLKSKSYYDSTLTSLPLDYPDYEIIKKKSDNLDLLADRLDIISREDTLQMLARLPEPERNIKISQLVLEELENAKAKPELSGNAISTKTSGSSGDNKFYFNNPVALKQGLEDFKRRWGNRKLEDNWRRSQRSANEIPTLMPAAQIDAPNPFSELQNLNEKVHQDSLTKTYLASIPLNAEQKAESDAKIASALYDIANYYRDIILDTAEAVKTYEQVLNRFPENQHKLAIYYNLYRLYSFADQSQSEKYKNILLEKYPESPFAKIILDPQYSQKMDDREQAFNHFYNDSYNLYINKNYTEVLNSIADYKRKSPAEKVHAQLAYLNALAIGHLQKLPDLEKAFEEIVNDFPEDELIVPLIQQHLNYIDSNRVSMAMRTVALSDQDMNNRFYQEPEHEQAISISQTKTDLPTPKNMNQSAVNQNIVAPKIEEKQVVPPAQATATVETGLFRKEESAIHYFVVNVSDPTLNLSSSRFGIGQFNRVNLPGSPIKHQLKPIENENRLIFVGPFSGNDAAKSYFDNISPMMRQIMKIPPAKYSIFIINEQNLDKIKNKETLDLYVEYYKLNY